MDNDITAQTEACLQADLHTANARINELNAKLQESENKRNPTRDQLLEQVRNLQNLLLSMKAPGSMPHGSGSDGTPVDTLLVGMDIGSETAMAAGAEKMCLQKTKDAELAAVRAAFFLPLVLGMPCFPCFDIEKVKQERSKSP